MEKTKGSSWLAVPITAAIFSAVVALLVWASTSSTDRAIASARPLANAIEASIDANSLAPLSLRPLGVTSDGNASFFNGYRILYLPNGRHFTLGIVVNDDNIIKYDSQSRSWQER